MPFPGMESWVRLGKSGWVRVAAMALEKTKLKHPSLKSRTATKTGKTCGFPEYRVQ